MLGASLVEKKEHGISSTGVAERPRRGWVQPGESAWEKVKHREVFPFDLDLSAVREKEATIVLGAVERDLLTRRDERDPDFVIRRSDFLRQPSGSIGKFEIVQLKERVTRRHACAIARGTRVTACCHSASVRLRMSS